MKFPPLDQTPISKLHSRASSQVPINIVKPTLSAARNTALMAMHNSFLGPMPARDFITVFLETDPNVLIRNLRDKHPKLGDEFQVFSDGMPEAEMYPYMASVHSLGNVCRALTASAGGDRHPIRAMPGDDIPGLLEHA